MQHNHNTELCFFRQYITEGNTIEATLLYNFFAKQFRFFFQFDFTSVGTVLNKRLPNIVTNMYPTILFQIWVKILF